MSDQVRHYYDSDDPRFTRPAESDASMFIQWKGTDVCMDFACPCGHSTHVDGMFCYAIICLCGAKYRLGTQVIAKLDPDYKGVAYRMKLPVAADGDAENEQVR